jgi:phosphoribosylanthranilate isomerase
VDIRSGALYFGYRPNFVIERLANIIRGDAISSLSDVRTRIKICCLSSSEEAQAAIAAGADAVGFVGVQPVSPRTISDDSIAEIVNRVPPPIATFLLTSADTADGIALKLNATSASVVQIVKPIDPAEIGRLRVLVPGIRCVQVIHVESEKSIELLSRYEPLVHAFLLDSGQLSSAAPEFGGTGRVHDWAISAEFVRQCRRPVFLAGGLTEDNVGKAISLVRPFGVDLCSGVRTKGSLDLSKLQRFTDAVRNADSEKATNSV